MDNKNIEVINFKNPREYLVTVYDEKHKQNPRYYTYDKFAAILGFSNKGFIYNYMYPEGKDGKKRFNNKKLTSIHCENISNALKHTDEESRYFLHIVHADQCYDEKEKMFHGKEAAKIRTASNVGMISQEQIQYYSQWYHSAIRSLIDIYPIKQDCEQLSALLVPPITPTQAKKSVQLLLKLGLISIGKDGFYHLEKNKIINTGKDIPQHVKNCSHLKFVDLAKKAIREIQPGSRYAVSHTIGISEATYKEITREIEVFRTTLRNIIDKDHTPERVYQLELLLFPLSTDKVVD